MLDVIDIIKKSENNTKYKAFAVVAPRFRASLALYEARSGNKGTQGARLPYGYRSCPAQTWSHMQNPKSWRRRLLTSSCCPAFVNYIEKSFPDLKPFISHNLPPLWRLYPNISKNMRRPARLYSIIPARQRKREVQKDEVGFAVDAVMTLKSFSLCSTAEILI